MCVCVCAARLHRGWTGPERFVSDLLCPAALRLTLNLNRSENQDLESGHQPHPDHIRTWRTRTWRVGEPGPLCYTPPRPEWGGACPASCEFSWPSQQLAFLMPCCHGNITGWPFSKWTVLFLCGSGWDNLASRWLPRVDSRLTNTFINLFKMKNNILLSTQNNGRSFTLKLIWTAVF